MAWLTVQEAAARLRVPVSWLYERTHTNSVPHVKLGTYLRFDRGESGGAVYCSSKKAPFDLLLREPNKSTALKQHPGDR